MMNLTPEERKEHMSMMAKKLWATKSATEKTAHALKMVRAKSQGQS